MKFPKQTSLALVCAGALSAMALFCAPARAAEGGSAGAAPVAASDSAAQHDFAKLSHAGTRMMENIVVARLALFEGHPALAAKTIKDAQADMQTAKKDDTAFMKAESDLSVPKGHEKPAHPDTAVKAWLPIGGDVSIVDDYTNLEPEKAKALAGANATLKQGNEKEAIRQLELADVNVISSVDLVPLEATATRLDEAAGLMATEKYYEAGQVLRRIEDSVRVASLDVSTTPTAKRAKK